MTAQTDPAFDIDRFLGNLTRRPGVYRMLDERGKYLYVGKAKDLKKRVSSYFQRRGHGPRIDTVVARPGRSK